MSGKFGAFLAGGAIGAALALLYAPRTGEQTRALVADRANDALDQAREYGSYAHERGQEIYDSMGAQGKVAYETASANASQAFSAATVNAQEVYASASSSAKETLEAARSRVSGMRDGMNPAFNDRNDELREKIEAARNRIASQVARNAEESAGRAPVDIPIQSDEDQPAAEALSGETASAETVE